MLEFTILDFVLTSALCYLLGVGTGLAVCCKNKDTFLQRVKSQEDLSNYNHHTTFPPPDMVMASAPPPLVPTDSLGIPLDKQKHIIIH